MLKLVHRIIINKITKKLPNKVLSGIFKGMKFGHENVYLKYILGTYEKELTPILEKILKIKFNKIIDIGAEMGYFAIGFAIKNKKSKIVTFESNLGCLDLIQKNAIANHVQDRIYTKAECNIEQLNDTIGSSKNTFLFVDCEGYEQNLLKPKLIPKLATCHIIVEIHDFVNPKIFTTIKRRFLNSHKIQTIYSKKRTIIDLPLELNSPLKDVFKDEYSELMNEDRPGQMRWLYLEPKIGNNIKYTNHQ